MMKKQSIQTLIVFACSLIFFVAANSYENAIEQERLNEMQPPTEFCYTCTFFDSCALADLEHEGNESCVSNSELRECYLWGPYCYGS